MMKKLEEMTLEELWQLFPIDLVPHNKEWKQWAREEIECLKNILSPVDAVYHHIGSTAIDNIISKPTVDIIVAVDDAMLLSPIKDRLVKAGYIVMAQIENRISLNKGYTPTGYADRVFHIHLRTTTDTDEIYFRDYLNTHPEVAKAYENLKLSLLPTYKHNRDRYTESKTSFVNHFTTIAKLYEQSK